MRALACDAARDHITWGQVEAGFKWKIQCGGQDSTTMVGEFRWAAAFGHGLSATPSSCINMMTSMQIMTSMGSKARAYTTLPVRTETLRRLKGYKVGGVSYDQLLNDLLDAHPPEEFFLEHLRRLNREPRRAWSEVRKELDL